MIEALQVLPLCLLILPEDSVFVSPDALTVPVVCGEIRSHRTRAGHDEEDQEYSSKIHQMSSRQ